MGFVVLSYSSDSRQIGVDLWMLEHFKLAANPGFIFQLTTFSVQITFLPCGRFLALQFQTVWNMTGWELNDLLSHPLTSAFLHLSSFEHSKVQIEDSIFYCCALRRILFITEIKVDTVPQSYPPRPGSERGKSVLQCVSMFNLTRQSNTVMWRLFNVFNEMILFCLLCCELNNRNLTNFKLILN